MAGPFGPVIGWIRRHRPEHAGRFVGPYLTAALTILVVLSLISIQRVGDYSTETQGALCALRGDLEQRVERSREFLRDHPEGLLGIPASAIHVSLEGQERTVAVLGSLDC
jgi:hypothetical protein